MTGVAGDNLGAEMCERKDVVSQLECADNDVVSCLNYAGVAKCNSACVTIPSPLLIALVRPMPSPLLEWTVATMLSVVLITLMSALPTIILKWVSTMLMAVSGALVSPVATPPLKEVVVRILLAISIVLASLVEMLSPVYEDARVPTGVQPRLV
jgi:hypothetical protein